MFKNHSYHYLGGAALMLMMAASALPAQVLHTNDKWDECAIVLDPSLTQEAWHQFISEVGLVMYFRPLAGAKPLGRGRVELAVLQTGTMIDDSDAAWNDTFSHPDADHWLFEGDALQIPGLMARVGVTDKVDVGAYFTKNFAANYGFLGGQVQYNLLNDTTRNVAAAGRASVVRLIGPEDMTATVFGADFLVSKSISIVTPYAGVSGYWSRGHERTSKVDLDDESELGVQGMAGVIVTVSRLRLGAEYN